MTEHNQLPPLFEIPPSEAELGAEAPPDQSLSKPSVQNQKCLATASCGPIFTAENFKALADEIGLDVISNEHQARLELIAGQFLDAKLDRHSAWLPGKARSELKKIAALAHELDKKLLQLDQPTMTLLLCHCQGYWEDVYDGNNPFAQVKQAALNAAQEITTRGGRTENTDNKLFIQRLAKLYEEATGKKPTRVYDCDEQVSRGPFHNFVRDVIDNVYQENELTNSGLDSLIRSVI